MTEVQELIAARVRELYDIEVSVDLTRPDEQFGDYATNVALQLSGKLGKNPREISESIAEGLSSKLIARSEVAGPGFINITLTDEALLNLAETGAAASLKDKVYVVEYSDPNPFKPLHAGHLYTTLVGDMIARLIERSGARVIRLNFGGDVGLHVGKSMWAIIQKLGGDFPEKLSEVPEKERPAWLGERYVEGNNAYEEDEAAKADIVAVNKGVYDIQTKGDHDSPFAQIYWTCRQWSYDYFSELYKQLDVVPFDRFIPESEVTELGLSTVREQLAKGVYEESDGAIIFDGEKHGLHKRVFINSAGLATYEAKDVGLSLTKWQDYKFDQSIIITANEQEQYMQVVLKSLEQYAPEPAERTRHIVHGVVKLAGGVKMSSRKGNVVAALEILNAARKAGAASGNSPPETTILAAVKYAFAKNRIGGDIVYDPFESIALEGNSGPYLQYAHARACSILRKAPDQEKESADSLQPDERSLVRKLGQYAETIELATEELKPHHICVYLYELAQKFNSFYEHNRVIGDERQQTRLMLVEKYAKTLGDGLELLGIHAPEQM